MTSAPAPAAVRVGGWDVTLIEGDALHAPLRWIRPHAEEGDREWLPCHVLLCSRGDEHVLVDCGLGVFEDAFEEIPTRTTGLYELLASVGCGATDITAIVLTHFDPDHSGGIVIGTYPDALEPAFVGVPVFVSETALALGEGRGQTRAEHAEHLVSALRGAGITVTGLAAGDPVTDGMQLRVAPGHREGHATVEIDDAGGRFVFLADALHAREHVEHPEWDTLNDSDPELGLATRRALIAGLLGSGTVVACSHVGGFGTIERSGNGPIWVDLP